MTITHYILKIVKTFFMDQTKLIHLDDVIMNCVLNGYPIHRKGYELLGGEPEWSKSTNHKCIIFSESIHGWNF